MPARASLWSRIISLVSVVAIALAGVALAIFAAPAAIAAQGPGPVINPPSGMVTGDALPTVQIDGVVWSQAIVGNTVYVGGEFKNARPAGSAPGQNLIPRSNLLAYDLTTGNLIASFAPSVNAKIKAVVASPDGTRVYIAGSFTSVNGVGRERIAAFDTATGSLVQSFNVHPYSSVYTLAVTNTTVYAGGPFTVVSGQPRSRLATFQATNGALLGWNPGTDYVVNALVLTPDGSKLIVGGAFQNVNNSPAYGLAAVDPVSSALLPWKANTVVRNAGKNAAILSLKSDGTKIYGTGYVFGTGGNLEGTFAADPDSGNVTWVEDCHGDTYDSYPVNGIIYTASHAHYCEPVGGFPQSDPWSTNMRHALAFTTDATGTLNHNMYGGYQDWFGTPSPSPVNWFPNLAVGSYTGATQAAWTITGNNQYVVMDGEFPKVNGQAQQGLVRFAAKPISPAKMAPKFSGAEFVPTAVGLNSGAIRVAWQSNEDIDDETLTYKLVRDGNTAQPVYQVTGDSTFWERPNLGFVDKTVAPGATYTYRLSATDSSGNIAVGDNVTVTAPAGGSTSQYATALAADGAQTYWPLDEKTGSVAVDNLGYSDADEQSGVGHGAVGATPGDTASTFDGTPNGSMSTRTAISGPETFSTEAWVKTTSTSGGKIIGFGSAKTGDSSSYDRHLYMDNSGRITFGVYPGTARAVTSARPYNDGKWHQVVSSLGPNGMALYVDGASVGSRTDTTSAQAYAGYWRVGGDNLSGWPNQPRSAYLLGAIDEVSIYPAALTSSQVAAHYAAASGLAPTATFSSAVSDLTVSVDGSASTDPDGTVAGFAWDFGDGGTATGANATHTYTKAGSYTVKLTVTDNSGATATSTQPVTVTAPPANKPPVAAFTYTTADLTANVDGSGSSDPDGTIKSYAWDFGDGGTDSTAVVAHSYAAPGAYPVTLTVTDDKDATNTVSQQLTVKAPPPPNSPPTAKFISAVSDLTLSVDAATSIDPDGTIVGYAWDFGDEVTTTGETATHTYATAGQYQVKLTVTDNTGAATAETELVTVTAPPVNQPPVAAFTVGTAGLTANVDGLGSSDPDGTIESYAGDFGDGGTASTAVVAHPYAKAGTYLVTLTVADGRGAMGTTSKPVAVEAAPPANTPPTAKFTAAVSDLSVAVDGSTSTAPNGSVVSYAWDFGDQATASVRTASHAYTATGTFPVTLTVTDDKGATATSMQTVTVSAPANQTVYAADAFGRTGASGLGTADAGGPWTLSGPGSWFGVNGSVAQFSMNTPGSGPAAYLNKVSASDVEVGVDVSLDKAPSGGGTYVTLAARRVGNSDYRLVAILKPGTTALMLSKNVNGTSITLGSQTIPALSYAVGDVVRMRFQVSDSGTANLVGKAWKVGATEPAAWQITASDSEASLRAAGGVGVQTYLSGSATNAPQVANLDNLAAKSTVVTADRWL